MQEKKAKPFLKWAGGKTQLLKDIELAMPKELISDSFTFIEPFVGSGAVLFWMLNNLPTLKKAYINDINEDLINTYKVIASEPENLIRILDDIQSDYHRMEDSEHDKKQYYYEKRKRYNDRISCHIEQASLFIFLNRTCFNGLYRVNRRNEYNVPIGSYKKPMICDKNNILAVSKALQCVEIICGDFEDMLDHAQGRTLFYFDPPYKPLSETSSFNSYAQNEFDDKEQIRLRDFCTKLNNLNHQWILSNSDVKEKKEEVGFFDELYSSFFIKRVEARRSINANANKRGTLNELLITNYQNSLEHV